MNSELYLIVSVSSTFTRAFRGSLIFCIQYKRK